MIRRLGLVASVAVVLGLPGAPGSAADEACRAAMRQRLVACIDACMAKARAAVDVSVKINDHACAKNCQKIEMFHGRACS